jgi:hypothetical protein
VLAVALPAALAFAAPGRTSARDFASLAHWLAGSYSNAAQVRRERGAVERRLRIVPIWVTRGDGYRWYYLERSAAGHERAPERQRVVRLTDLGDGTIEGAVYALPGASRFAGEWKQDLPLVRLSPDSLRALEGCALYFSRAADGSFAGATRGEGCAGERDPNVREKTELTVLRDRVILNERAFAPGGAQVSGRTSGADEFLRAREP